MKVLEFINGKRTYLIAAVVVILGFLQGMDIFTVPEHVWAIAGGLGLTTLRSGVNKVAGTVKPNEKATPDN